MQRLLPEALSRILNISSYPLDNSFIDFPLSYLLLPLIVFSLFLILPHLINHFTPYLLKKEALIKGFTLIELLIVVAIIAVLAVIGIALFSNVKTSGDKARLQSDINSVAKALDNHKTCNADGSGNTGTFYCFPVQAAWFINGAIPAAPSGYTYDLGTTSTTGLAGFTVSGSGSGFTHKRLNAL